MLLWIDGFETYGTVNDAIPSPEGCLGRRYTTSLDGSSTSYTKIKPGREYGQSIWLSYSTLTTPALTTDTTLIVGFAFKVETFNNCYFCQLLNNSADFSVKFVGDEIELKRGSTVLGTTTTLSLNTDEWYWLELKVYCDNTVGTYDLKINNTTALSGSGDTSDGEDYYNFVRIGAESGILDIQIDDFYVCDSSGSNNNDFLGECRVTAIRPNGNGTISEMAPSIGSNYSCVNDSDDNTYVEGDSGKSDVYTYSDVSGLTGIKGICLRSRCLETDAESFNMRPIMLVNGNTHFGSYAQVGSSDYTKHEEIIEENPDTSSAWTSTDINDSEFGLEIS